jgi:hypothetical protein
LTDIAMTPLLLALSVLATPAPVTGDFDHDGRSDRAEIVTVSDGAYQLQVQPGAVGAKPLVVADLQPSQLRDLFVEKASPGRVRTRCADVTDDKCRRTVELAGDTLSFGTREASHAMAIWRGDRFEVVWISD